MRYLWSLLRTSLAPRNWVISLFILLNCAVLFYGVITPVWMVSVPEGSLGLLFVLFSIVYIALVLWAGGWILRLMFHGNRMVAGSDFSNTAVAFAEAYTLAVAQDPTISRNVRLYICNVNFPAAYAFGRTTILISSAATQLPRQQIQALLLSKFAQLSNHDSERHLLLIAGNAVFIGSILLTKAAVYLCVGCIVLICSVLRAVMAIFTPRVPFGGGLFAVSAYFNVCRVLSNFLESVLLFVLNMLIRLALLTAQSNYFINDRFVCNCGCSGELRQYLQQSAPDLSGYRSTLETIAAAAPARQARISRLEEYLVSGIGVSRRPVQTERDPLRIHVNPNPGLRTPRPNRPTTTHGSGFSVISRNDQ